MDLNWLSRLKKTKKGVFIRVRVGNDTVSANTKYIAEFLLIAYENPKDSVTPT